MRVTRTFVCIAAIAALQAACSAIRPQRGGSASIGGQPIANTRNATIPSFTGGLPTATLTQPENPAATSGQSASYERTTETSTPVESSTKTETTFPDGRKVTVIETRPAGTVVRESVKQGVTQEISGSWKDTAREIAAKMGAYRGVQILGVILLLAAVSMFHPVVRTVVGGGKSTQMAVAAAGVLLIFGPSLVVGNEKLLLVAVVGFLAWHYLSSRLAYKEGIIDANNNGIPDDQEKTKNVSN